MPRRTNSKDNRSLREYSQMCAQYLVRGHLQDIIEGRTPLIDQPIHLEHAHQEPPKNIFSTSRENAPLAEVPSISPSVHDLANPPRRTKTPTYPRTPGSRTRSASTISQPPAHRSWENSTTTNSVSPDISEVDDTHTDTKITLDINDLPVADEFRVREWIHGRDTNCEAIEIRIVDKDQSDIVSTNATPSIRSRASTPREPLKPHVQHTKAETQSQNNPEVHIAQPKKELIITLGKDQVTQPVGPVGKTSMIHVRMWTRYMLWLKTKGKKHNAYAKFSKTPPKPGDEKMITLQGRTYLCYGPFIADINLDGIDMKVPLMITTDTEFGYGITLGDDFWRPRKIAAISGVSTAVPLNTCSHTQLTVQGKRYNVLVDTGAGPSCMAKHVFDSIGGDTTQLTAVRGKVTAANDSELQVWGISKPIEFCIQPYTLTMCFMIVENLGQDHMILGRDFLKHYDVSVDVARSELLIRNPAREYTVHTVYKVDQTNSMLRCKITNDEWINGGDMKSCHYTAIPKRQQEHTLCDKDWLAYVEPLHSVKSENKGIRIANAITMVRRGVTDIMVMNANATDQGAAHITQKDSLVKLHPVTVAYERRWHHGPLPDDVHTDHQVTGLNHDSKDNDTSSGITSLSLQSEDRSMRSRSEYPADDTDKRPFCIRPEVMHLRSRLTEQQYMDLNSILDKNGQAFSQTPKDIGHTRLVQHTIDTKEGTKPFKEQLKRLHPSKKRLADEHIHTLLEMGVIREARSPFASAITLVQRANGASRFCVDFRKLNNMTVKQSFTLPVLEDHVEQLATAKYFTTIDLGNACWQVGLDEESIQKTAFITQDNQYEWTRMPFGLCNSTATFQKLMAKTIGQMTSRYGNLVLCYVDEILIATDTPERHIFRLDEVLTCLSRAGLKIKAAKCKIMEPQVKFLGRIISEHGIQPDVASIEKVTSWKEPRNAAELEYFLGFASYYREFIKGYANIAAPLTKYMSKNRDFDWDREAQQAFEQLKHSLTTAPILGLPNDTGTFVLDTDASRVAISGILHQWQTIQGKDRLVVINYASRGLKGSERKYSAARSEMLAALTFIEHNRKWLQHREFVIRCDNQAFSWLKTYNTKSEHVGRWINRLDTFNMVIQHRSRNHHTNADGLSKKTEYYQRVEQRPMGDKAVGFNFMSQDEYDKLPRDNHHEDTVVNDALTTREQPLPPTEPQEDNVTPIHLPSKITTESTDPMTILQEQLQDHSISKIERDEITKQTRDIITQMTEPVQEIYSPRYCMPYGFEKREQECQQLSHDDLWQPQYQKQIAEAWQFSVNKIRSKLRTRYGSHELAHAQKSDMVLRIYRQMLQQDPTKAPVMHPVLHDNHRRWFRTHKKDLKINEQDILVHQTRYRDGTPLAWTIVMPDKYTPEIIRNAHDMSGHHGIQFTKTIIRHEFTWPTMDEEVATHVTNCKRCRLGRGELPEAEYKGDPLTSKKINDLIICDFHAFSTNAEGYKGIWIIMDHWSRYIRIIPLKECDAKTVTKTLLDSWIHPFGVPNKIYTDQGKLFEMELFSELLRLFDITKTYGTDAKTAKARGKYPLDPIIMKTLTKCIRLNKDKWHTQVNSIAAAYNQMVNPVTKYAPNEIFLCKRTNMPLSWFYPNFCREQNKNTLPKWVEEKLTTLQMIHKEMSKHAQQPMVRLEQTPVRLDGQLPNLQIGSMAFIFSHIAQKRKTRKTEPQWNGPVKCTGIFNDGIHYTFDKVVDNKKVHFSMIKPHIPKKGEPEIIPLRSQIEILGGDNGITIIYPGGAAPPETIQPCVTVPETASPNAPSPELTQPVVTDEQPMMDTQPAATDTQAEATHIVLPTVPIRDAPGQRPRIPRQAYYRLRDRTKLSTRVGDNFVKPPIRKTITKDHPAYYEYHNASESESNPDDDSEQAPTTVDPPVELHIRYQSEDGQELTLPSPTEIATQRNGTTREAVPQSQIIEEQPTSLQGNDTGSEDEHTDPSTASDGAESQSDGESSVNRHPGEIHLDHEYATPFIQQGPQLGIPASATSSAQETGPPLKETRLITSKVTHDIAWGSTDDDCDDEDAPQPTVICALNRPVITTARQDIINTKGHMVIDIAADLEVGQGIRKDIARLHGGLDQHFQLRRQPGDIITIPSYQTTDGNYIFYVISRYRNSDPFDLTYYSEGLAKVRDIAKGCGFTDIYTIKVPFVRDNCTGMDVRNVLQRTFGNAGIHVRLCLDPFGS